jgi:hypothetical protein
MNELQSWAERLYVAILSGRVLPYKTWYLIGTPIVEQSKKVPVWESGFTMMIELLLGTI